MFPFLKDNAGIADILFSSEMSRHTGLTGEDEVWQHLHEASYVLGKLLTIMRPRIREERQLQNGGWRLNAKGKEETEGDICSISVWMRYSICRRCMLSLRVHDS